MVVGDGMLRIWFVPNRESIIFGLQFHIGARIYVNLDDRCLVNRIGRLLNVLGVRDGCVTIVGIHRDNRHMFSDVLRDESYHRACLHIDLYRPGQ